jgi:hypothetical protein
MTKEYYLGIGEKLDIFFIMEYDVNKKNEFIYKIFYNKDKCEEEIKKINKNTMEELIE